MSKCGNCGSKITCGCQRATAADGKSVCKNCIGTYNKQLTVKPVVQKKEDLSDLEVSQDGVLQVTATYTGPGRQIL